MAMKVIEIDRSRWIEALRMVGLTQIKLSKELGLSDNYISSTIAQQNGLPYMVANYVEKIYGIKPETYAPVSAEREEAQYRADNLELIISRSLDAYQPIDYERLYKVIYSAVFEAMDKVLNGKNEE